MVVPRTKDHEVIRRWVDQRGGKPARVRGTGDLLRISFGKSPMNLEEITWEQFFEAFDRNKLLFLYEEDPSTRFSKFVRTS
ncbi:MAG: hypothetical protein HY690_17240 [Chloroflexi bacterium]|nr:hypothetical protein [Chloroflexota bacterium]